MFALSGFARGLVAQVLSIVGVAAGLVLGAWIAPQLLPMGVRSGWVPVASLVGALLGVLVFALATGPVAGTARAFLARRPLLRGLDRAGGALGGAGVGVALAWIAAVLLLHQPALGLRPAVQESTLLARLVRALPPEPVLRALERFDPLPLLPDSAPRLLPSPDPGILGVRAARNAAASVVKVSGTSCGLGLQGSGWIVRPGLVATNAHVVSGQRDTTIADHDGVRRDASIVYLDARNDVALLRVQGLRTRALPTDAGGTYPRKVVLLGYPGDGPLTAVAGTAGEPRTVIASDAYDRRAGRRVVVPLRGGVQPGESGGPVVDADGRVVAMIFAGTRNGRGGFGVPVELVVGGLARALRPVDAGPCVG